MYVCVCVCMNENAASLQPADNWLAGSSSPLPVCACVFYKAVCILTKRYADDMLRAVILMQVSNPLTHSLYAAVPRNYNKYKKINTDYLSG